MKKIAILLIAIVTAWFGLMAYSLFSPVVTTDDGIIYYLKPNTSKKAVIEGLAELGMVPHPWIFMVYAFPQTDAHLKTGEYLFKKGSTPASIWRQLTQGKGLYYHAFTIVPGWTFIQIKQALAATDALHHTSAELSDTALMVKLGYPNKLPEGQFFPETYYYTRGVADTVILKQAIDLMQKRLNEAWQKRSPNLPYTTQEAALIVASLVEKEAYLNEERPMIAGVIVNRLRKNMLLQIDPTVIYGMGTRYTGKIHKEDLQTDTPYNTYLHKGLPPTPIAMPGLASINAAMQPQIHDYYYFVATGQGGAHQFSKTLPEHNTAVSGAIKKQQAIQPIQGQPVSFFNEERIKIYIHLHLAQLAYQSGMLV